MVSGVSGLGIRVPGLGFQAFAGSGFLGVGSSIVLLKQIETPWRSRGHMVLSQNRGTPTWTPIYYSPYYKDPQKRYP